jgi:hypothetical protein
MPIAHGDVIVPNKPIPAYDSLVLNEPKKTFQSHSSLNVNDSKSFHMQQIGLNQLCVSVETYRTHLRHFLSAIKSKEMNDI